MGTITTGMKNSFGASVEASQARRTGLAHGQGNIDREDEQVEIQ